MEMEDEVDKDTTPPPHPPSSEDNDKRIRSLEEKVEQLIKEKDELLKREEELITSSQSEKDHLSTLLNKLQDELNEAKSLVTIAQLSKENEVEIEKSKYQQDLTQMRIHFEKKLHHIRTKYEDELCHLRERAKEAQAAKDKEDDTFSLSHMTKTLARRLNHSVSASSESLSTMEERDKEQHQGRRGGGTGTGKYASEDQEMLRSLVCQLEEEVSALKDRLRDSDEKLKAMEDAQGAIAKGNDALTHLLQGEENVPKVLSDLDNKLKQAHEGLEAEKSSRADLEMYVAFANAQKTVLQEELDKAKGQLREMRISYEHERKQHEELKETWEKANEHFVTTQNDYISLIERYRQVMSPEQMKKLKEDSQSLLHLSSDDESDGKKHSIPPTAPDPPQTCPECEKNLDLLAKLRSDLLKAAQLRNEMEDEWNRVSLDTQSKVASLEDQIGTYDAVLLELNTFCQQSAAEMESRLKRLSFERESVQRKIEKMEVENDILKGKHVAHSLQLQNEYISLPQDVMELQEMVLKLREDLISVKVGKEQIESEFKFLKDQLRMLEEEKATVEESLNNEITSYQNKISDLSQNLQRVEEQGKSHSDLRNKLFASEAQIGKLKVKNEEFTKEKEDLQHQIQDLQGKVQTLRRELTNSEELQKDLIALSKSLQVNLESIRQAETEVRWQHPDDVPHCNSCRKQLAQDKEKINCKHCGRIFCQSCVTRTVRRGNREYNVCGVCHTLLAHEAAPYFSTEPPHSPD